MLGNLFWSISIIISLIVLNGLFSLGEFAIISARKSKIKEMVKEGKEKKAETLLRMREKPENFLSLVQIGITLVGTLAAGIGGIIAVTYVRPVVTGIPYLAEASETVPLLVVVIPLTYVTIVAGELLPKYIGINYRERAAMRIRLCSSYYRKSLQALYGYSMCRRERSRGFWASRRLTR